MTGQTRRVQGFCPMGCGETLFLGAGGYVTCGFLKCPNPSAATGLLSERETEHIVTLKPAGSFTIRHPMRERAGISDLEECQIHEYLSSLGGPPRQPGKYRVKQDKDGQWTIWTLV